MMEVLFLKLEDYKRACIVLLSKTGHFILLAERIKIFNLFEAPCKRVYRVFQSNQKVFHQASIKKFPLFPFFLRDFTNPLNLVNLWSLSTPEFLYSLDHISFCDICVSLNYRWGVILF